MEAKLALARFIVTRSHGEEAAAEAEAHFTRVVREGKAPEEIPEAALPGRRSGARSCPPGSGFRHVDERRAPADRRRRGEGRRRGRHRARHAARTACRSRFAGREAPLRPLDRLLTAAIIPRLPERAAWKQSPDQEFPTEQPRRKSKVRDSSGASGGLGRPFSRPPGKQHRSLKTQQRAFTSRPLGRLWLAGRKQDPSTTASIVGDTLSTSSKRSLPAFWFTRVDGKPSSRRV